MKKWLEQIQAKIVHMSRKEKCDYILTYYWHYMLGAAIFVGLIILVIYHFFFGQKEILYRIAIVNHKIDHQRDEQLRDEVARVLGVSEELIVVDSNYVFSFGDVTFESVNESSYEKLFFNWSLGDLDLVIMPNNFYEYCKTIDSTFEDLSWLDFEEQNESRKTFRETLEIKSTRFERYINAEEAFLITIPVESQRKEVSKELLAWAIDKEEE